MASCLTRIVYHGGSDVNQMSVRSFGGLHTAAPRLEELCIPDLKDGIPIEAASSLEQLPRLTRLEIGFDDSVSENFIGADGALPQAIFKLTNLKSLKLTCSQLRGIQPTIARFKELRHLHLEHLTALPSLPLMTVHMSKIETLSLRGSKSLFAKSARNRNGPGEPGSERMWYLIRSLKSLKKLILDDCGLSEIPILEGVPVNTTLNFLSMNNNPGMGFKKGLSCFQALNELHMRNCNMPCLSSAVWSLPMLRVLDISKNDMVECYGLSKLQNLEVIKASSNPFPSIPKDFMYMKTLRRIDLINCVYLEVASPMTVMVDKLPHLELLDVRKQGNSRFQHMSKHWLAQLGEEYICRHSRNPVVWQHSDT